LMFVDELGNAHRALITTDGRPRLLHW
jgi:hypothetical protein